MLRDLCSNRLQGLRSGFHHVVTACAVYVHVHKTRRQCFSGCENFASATGNFYQAPPADSGYFFALNDNHYVGNFIERSHSAIGVDDQRLH